MRVDLEPGYVLSQRPYRETSLLVEAFCLHHGRVGLVARGARVGRRPRYELKPFTPLLLSWFGRGELYTLAAAESQDAALALAGERIFFGWYLNELLLRLLQRHVPYEDLYAIYARTLERLPCAEAETALRIFEKRLLADLGYALPLPADLRADRRYRFDAEQGSFAPADEDSRAYSGAHLIALREERLSGHEVLRDARRLLRTALAYQLGGRELETPKLLRAMRRRVPARIVEAATEAAAPPRTSG